MIEDEIRAFEGMRESLEQHHFGKFVVIHGGVLIVAFDTIEAAAKEAAQKLGARPYLIRQVGALTTVPMPASLAHFSSYAAT